MRVTWKKGGIYRREYLYWTYMRVPPHNVGSGTTEMFGTNENRQANIIQAFLVTYFNKLVTLWRTLLYDMNYIMNYIWILIIRVWHNEDKVKYLFPEFHQYFPNTHNIGVISSKTRGLLIWRLHCLSLICLLNLVASVKLNNELYNLDYLQCVWSKWLPTWLSKNLFVIIVLDISHTNWLKLKLC